MCGVAGRGLVRFGAVRFGKARQDKVKAAEFSQSPFFVGKSDYPTHVSRIPFRAIVRAW